MLTYEIGTCVFYFISALLIHSKITPIPTKMQTHTHEPTEEPHINYK